MLILCSTEMQNIEIHLQVPDAIENPWLLMSYQMSKFFTDLCSLAIVAEYC